MEKVEYHTPEEKEACNMIKSLRKRARERLFGKGITIPFDRIENKNISAKLTIHVHKVTGNISMAHSLGIAGCSIYPSKNQKLICTNQHALDCLRYKKRMFNDKRRQRILFLNYLEYYTRIDEYIDYYEDTGTVHCGTAINCEKKLKYIDEK